MTKLVPDKKKKKISGDPLKDEDKATTAKAISVKRALRANKAAASEGGEPAEQRKLTLDEKLRAKIASSKPQIKEDPQLTEDPAPSSEPQVGRSSRTKSSEESLL